MKRFCIVILSLYLITLAQTALCWGGKGHDIVAGIAWRHMTPKAKAAVTKSLDGYSMMYYSTWLDNARNNSDYDTTSTWHYANVDEGFTYETMTKNPKGDVYTATTSLVEALKDKQLSDSLRTFYTKCLIHLVGDLHCPMHAGHLSDLGGNKWKVKWFNSETSLHSIWDSRLIESARPWSYTEWVENLDVLPEGKIKQMQNGTPYIWFNETVAASKHLYDVTPEGSNQSYQYIYDNTPMLEEQLLKGGYRLAALLNSIYK